MLKRLAKSVTRACCWAHARRALHDATPSGAARIQALYRIEKALRGFTLGHRQVARQERAEPILDTCDAWPAQSRVRVSAQSPTGEALKYWAKYWNRLILLLDDDRSEMTASRSH